MGVNLDRLLPEPPVALRPASLAVVAGVTFSLGGPILLIVGAVKVVGRQGLALGAGGERVRAGSAVRPEWIERVNTNEVRMSS
jgi:hypothetical protein